MTETAASILERFRLSFGKDMDLTLRAPYRDLLDKLGNPEKKLERVIHVAGTNGKGSTSAFLRAFLEAGGFSVNVYSSPHLVSVHERFRLSGKLIEESELCAILQKCEALAEPGKVSYFEAATAAAFEAFASHPADVTILEVGLGGRLDATNVLDAPAACVITRLSFDHREFLGDTLASIAHEKAGIMRNGIPCFSAPQPSDEARETLEYCAKALGVPLSRGGYEWKVEALPAATPEAAFRFTDKDGSLDLPAPSLAGQHQYLNAGLAIATLKALDLPVSEHSLRAGLKSVEWPARLQPITAGPLRDKLPVSWELWLDGGHNDSAGEVLGLQASRWQRQDPAKPLFLVYGMLANKDAQAFLTPIAPFVQALRTVPIEGETLAQTPELLAAEAIKADIPDVRAAQNFIEALEALAQKNEKPARVLICGSLYLAGRFLAENGG